MKIRNVFKVEDLQLGKVVLDEDKENWYLYVGRRDIQIDKKTKEIVGSGTWVTESTCEVDKNRRDVNGFRGN